MKSVKQIVDMLDDKVECKHTKKIELDDIATFIVRGGWPANIKISKDDIQIIPKDYVESLITKDIHERKDKKRDSNKMRMLLKSLARNEATIAGYDTIVKDIETYENKKELIESRQTVADYISVLDNLYVTSYQEAFNINYRSSDRIGKSPKRHLVDPSLSRACLNLSIEKLLNDHKVFGYMFESLVERDLKIYIEYLNGHLYHFRDNISGDEVDSIVEFENGDYGAIEIKLTELGIDDGKKSLKKFFDNVKIKPKFMCIIVGHYEAIMKDPETGIYIIPITTLKP